MAYLPGAAERSTQRLDWSRGFALPTLVGLFGLVIGAVAVKGLLS